MINVKRILMMVLVTLFVLVILVNVSISTILFYKYVELKEVTEEIRNENFQLKFNRGKYIDLKTTIEEQRKEMMRIEQRNALCLNKYEETLSELRKCEDGGRNNVESMSENNLLD
jgi:hypothetical protein